MQTWQMLVVCPKWKDKTIHALQLSLNKLKNYDEDFAILLMEDAIENNWQGIVYDSTAQKYEAWKKQRNPELFPEKEEKPQEVSPYKVVKREADGSIVLANGSKILPNGDVRYSSGFIGAGMGASLMQKVVW